MVVDAARRRCGILSSNSSHNLSWQQHLALALSVTAGRADASLCATVDSYETRWTESFRTCLESIPELGCVAARVV